MIASVGSFEVIDSFKDGSHKYKRSKKLLIGSEMIQFLFNKNGKDKCIIAGTRYIAFKRTVFNHLSCLTRFLPMPSSPQVW